MESMTGEQIEAAFGFPGIVEFEGRWWVADRVAIPNEGDPCWWGNHVERSPGDDSVCLILRAIEAPPKPTQEWLDAHVPEGMKATCGGTPDKTSVPFATEGAIVHTCNTAYRVKHDYRWPVTLTPIESNPAPVTITLADVRARLEEVVEMMGKLEGQGK